MEKVSKKNSHVDVHDSELMIELGIHPPYLADKDESVWTKTDSEKRLIKQLKHSHKGDIHFHSVPIRPIPVKAKLIIQLEKNNTFPNTTYSTICYMHKIGDILSNFYAENPNTKLMHNVVAKYTYNGKEYKPDERPFWKY